MQRYYSRSIKKYVGFLFNDNDGSLKVTMIATSTGLVLGVITLPFSTGRKNCAYLNTKKFPWLYQFLIENNIGHPTFKCLVKDGFTYSEFQFNTEV